LHFFLNSLTVAAAAAEHSKPQQHT
jgi:hypothetical protein